ncbi:MAG: hypothetical protein Tsb0020_31120 [Haliangiales bacterium]
MGRGFQRSPRTSWPKRNAESGPIARADRAVNQAATAAPSDKNLRRLSAIPLTLARIRPHITCRDLIGRESAALCPRCAAGKAQALGR